MLSLARKVLGDKTGHVMELLLSPVGEILDYIKENLSDSLDVLEEDTEGNVPIERVTINLR